MREPGTSASFCSVCGMTGRRTTSKWWFATTARRSGLGIPFFLSAVALNWFLAGSAGVRRWLLPLERLAGAVLLLIGVLLLTGQFAALSALLSRFTPAIEVGL